MRQRGLADDVADGKDVGHVDAHLAMDLRSGDCGALLPFGNESFGCCDKGQKPAVFPSSSGEMAIKLVCV